MADSTSDAIRQQLESSNPGLHIKNIQPSPIAGLYEIYANGAILYTDSHGKYVLAGARMIEDAGKRNLTEERLKELSKIKFDTLPIKQAIEIKKGSGAYRFAIFSDPDCPYCKNLEVGLDKMGITNYTAYVFLLPLEEIHKDARWKAESIWCASDRPEAWKGWMVDGKLPEKKSCDTPIDSIAKLGGELGVAGTPTIYLEDGTLSSSPQELINAITAKK
jgi:thiol:disulfide interchange protein DsbC